MVIQIIVCSLVIVLCCGAPAPTKTPPSPPPVEINMGDQEVSQQEAENMNTGLYYDQYLQKVVKLLESDEQFKKKMENADFDDIKEGRLSDEINKMPQSLRDKLNDLKKEEINRLRKIVHAKVDLEKGRRVQKTPYLKQIANHLDHDNPHTFEASDLTNLIRAATSDLENYDQERHEEFKKYEMEKEARREAKMQKLDEQDRQKAREEYIQHQKELAEKAQMHHPGSKAQLEDVWNDEDGLNEQEFNPKTFFNIHDINGDGYLDFSELESIFEKDLGKVYNENDPEFDFLKMEEERRRMREHVVKEVDKNRDGLISRDEFIQYSETPEFAQPDEDSYKNLDQLLAEHSLYTQEEMNRYRETIKNQEEILKTKLDALKAHAKELGGMRREFGNDRREAAQDGLQEEEKIHLQQKEKEIKEQEEKMQMLHKDLQEQSKEILQMKQELQKHEASDKIVQNIKEKVDNLPPGPEKDHAVEQAHKDLDNLKKIQTPEQKSDLSVEEGANFSTETPVSAESTPAPAAP
uniref:Nucleobindin-2 n=1 Tax=Phallusia mammillata TaxID=59560 RepID=A0A6F9DNA4_9ASCI|nr:nucleobindin-2 [Phallusia mammillata]